MFSIILPTFNRCNLISYSIESVLDQKYPKWELIIVDDGSTDNTRALVSKFLKKDNRIRYIFQKNTERSVARNNGINAAKGDWICFLDSDDKFHTTHLNELRKLIEKNKFQKGLYFSGLSINKYCDEEEKYDMSGSNNIEFVILNTIGTPRASVHKEVFSKYLFNPRIRIGEDTELWVRILTDYPLFFHYKKTFIMINHKNRSIALNRTLEDVKVKKKIVTDFKDEISKENRLKYISDAYFFKAKATFLRGDKFRFIIFTLASCFKFPNKSNFRDKLNYIFKSIILSEKKFEELIK